MANELKKEAFLQFKDEPHLRPISDEGIGFYNLDINTSVLTFQLTKQDKPLLISDKNVTAYAYFKSDNGSTSGVLDLEFKDPMNGIVSITLPKDFLQASTGTRVTGQTYISTNGKEDTAVFSEFTFTVKNALINTISSTVKIEYIKMFDRLKQEIEKRVHDIEQAIANGSDYVAQMQNVLSDGIKQINDTVTQAKKDVNTTATNATNTITSTKNSAITTVNTARDEVLTAIKDNQVVKTTDLPSQFNALTWQKYKLTNDDGTNFYDSSLIVDFNDSDQLIKLPSGVRYVSSSKNQPTGVSYNGWLTKYSRSDSQMMLIQYQPYN
ncbi:phage baseplate upper protein, partial [Staphylococcus epidermidis]|nr:phage baseplate upper protein [Staphylococcus epidermidis]